MKNKQIMGALAMDLKRVALGCHRGSFVMAEKFYQEAIKRKNEIDTKNLKPYILRLLNQIDQLNLKNDRAAEDALLYSTLFQNASQT